MATIYIDNSPHEVKDGQNLLQACLSLGFDIPYFCWHPALGSVGACRLCAIKLFKDEADTKGRIVMSCMTPVSEGLRMSIDDEEVRAFRSSVIEWLMTNHPHDCPVCDEGGECHLQDMTVLTGHKNRKYRFTKRTHNNQYLGPFINHEMNRCIQCYRCVRYYRDYAGGRDFNVFASHNHVYFGRHEAGVLENEFSGNLVEVCPTGVFTDKSFKTHFTRPWDLQTAPSVCVHCGLGCNVTPGERYGKLRRIRNRYNGAVNGYFLCDRGRYGYEFVNSEKRITQPHQKKTRDAAPAPVEKAELLAALGQSLRDNPKVIGIGSPRASLESNFALRTLVGADRFFAGLTKHDNLLLDAMLTTLRLSGVRTPSLSEIGDSDAVLVLGEDVSNTAPLVALQLHQSQRIQPREKSRKLRIPDWDDNNVREVVQDDRGPLFVASLGGTGLDADATRAYTAAPDDLARLGFAVAHAIDSQAPAVQNLSPELAALAEQIAETLSTAQKPLVISGSSSGSLAVIQAAAQVAQALQAKTKPVSLFYTAAECNSLGIAMMGGGNLEEAARRLVSGEAETVVIVENDLYRRADRTMIDEMLNAAKQVIVLDYGWTETASKADVAIPVSTYADGDGTLVNNEGRAQRFIQVFMPEGSVSESWRWLGEILSSGWGVIDDIQAALEQVLPAFSGISRASCPADARFAGQRLPRQPLRYSGRTSMCANINVHEPGIPNDPDSPFTFSMEGFRGETPGAVIPSYNTPGWNSVQGLNKFQAEVGGPLRGGDPGVRLIEPAVGQSTTYATDIPGAFQVKSGEYLLLTGHHLFGSDEWSVQTPAIAERVRAPYIAMNPADAASMSVQPAEYVTVTISGQCACRLPVEYRAALSRGVALLPVGICGVPVVSGPTAAVIVKEVAP